VLVSIGLDTWRTVFPANGVQAMDQDQSAVPHIICAPKILMAAVEKIRTEVFRMAPYVCRLKLLSRALLLPFRAQTFHHHVQLTIFPVIHTSGK
jgi:hypothetical protein